MNKHKIEFAVIIPVYNDFNRLRNTLSGIVRAQSLADVLIEVFLVDNNSKTEINTVFEEYVQKLSNLYLIRRPKLAHTFALCSARNIALRQSQASWMVSLDGDCIPGPDYFIKLKAALTKNHYSVAVGERVYVDYPGPRGADIETDNAFLGNLVPISSVANYGLIKDRRFPGLKDLSEHTFPFALVHGGNFAFSRLSALTIGGFDEAYDGNWGYEDFDFAYRLFIETGCEFNFVEDMQVYHQEPDARAPNPRIDRMLNPNWNRITALIPGLENFLRSEYKRMEESKRNLASAS